MMLWLSAVLIARELPEVTLHPGTNNVAGAPWRSSDGTRKYLGLYNTTDECQWACLSGPPPMGAFCCSFTFHTPAYEESNPHGWSKQCYGVTIGHWAPAQQANITSGRVAWPAGSAAALACTAPAPKPPPAPPSLPCSTALDCGLNGVCHRSGVYECRAAWTGDHCQTLALLPANLSAGYRYTNLSTGANISSWGGSVLWSDEDHMWHMFAAEMLNSCGLKAWACNSQVVHATTPSLEQCFVLTDAVTSFGSSSDSVSQPRFAHEPNVVRGPKGEWTIFWTGCNPSAPAGSSDSCDPAFPSEHVAPADCASLGDGSTPPSADIGRGHRSNDHTWMAWAPSPSGPWSRPIMVLNGSGIDTSLSPAILPNGSLLGLWRGGLNASRPWSTIQRVTASDWRDPATYLPEYDDLFPDVHSTEDPHVYTDNDGHFHAIFHHCFKCRKPRVCGGHAYSFDGVDWHYPYVNGSAYDEKVLLADGRELEFSRRERPHLVFGSDNSPIASTNGAGLDGVGKYGDATWTFLQPLKTEATE